MCAQNRCNFESYILEGFTVLKLTGDFDYGSLPSFRKAIRPIQEESQEVVLDLSELDYLDSSGLAKMLALYREQGNRLLIVSNELVDNILSLTRLDRTFERCNSRSKLQEALMDRR